jgi:hypothetical protein
LLIVPGLARACENRQLSAANLESSLKPYVDPDAYLIYAVLLESAKQSSFIIQSETDSWSGVTPDNVGIKGDHNFQMVWGGVIKDFADKYKQSKLLTRDIPIELTYELVPREKMPEPSQLTGGDYSFSAVGFDPGRTHAIVDMNYSCGALCGGGGPHFLEKRNGKWREVSVNAEVEVRAS